jgi:hypothetical protein
MSKPRCIPLPDYSGKFETMKRATSGRSASEEILKSLGRDTFLVVLALKEPAFEVLASARLGSKMIIDDVASPCPPDWCLDLYPCASQG